MARHYLRIVICHGTFIHNTMKIKVNEFITIYGNVVMYDNKVAKDTVKSMVKDRMEILAMVTIPQKIDELFGELTFVPWERLKASMEMVDKYGETIIPMALLDPLRDMLEIEHENYLCKAAGDFLIITSK